MIFDRVLETTTTTGTGALTLAGAVTGYQAFDDVLVEDDTFSYCVFAADEAGAPTGDWEVGTGTFNSSGEIERTAVEASSNSDAAVDFAAGTKRVMLTVQAADYETFSGGSGSTIVRFTADGTLGSYSADVPAECSLARVRVSGRCTAGPPNLVMTFNNDTSASYAYQYIQGANTAEDGVQALGASFIFIGGVTGTAETAGGVGVAEIAVLRPRDTTFNTTCTGTYFVDRGATLRAAAFGGALRKTDAVSSIQIALSAGNFALGSVIEFEFLP